VLNSKDPVYDEPVHVFNLDVVDNHEAAVEGALKAYALAMIVRIPPLRVPALLALVDSPLPIRSIATRTNGKTKWMT